MARRTPHTQHLFQPASVQKQNGEKVLYCMHGFVSVPCVAYHAEAKNCAPYLAKTRQYLANDNMHTSLLSHWSSKEKFIFVVLMRINVRFRDFQKRQIVEKILKNARLIVEKLAFKESIFGSHNWKIFRFNRSKEKISKNLPPRAPIKAVHLSGGQKEKIYEFQTLIRLNR